MNLEAGKGTFCLQASDPQACAGILKILRITQNGRFQWVESPFDLSNASTFSELHDYKGIGNCWASAKG